jgi:predicted PurR-regulated permease PerM
MPEKPIQITITPGTIVAAVLILLGFWLAWYLRDLLLVVITAIVLASAIEPATVRLMKWHVPRVIAVVLIYLLTFTVLALLFYLVVPPLAKEANGFVTALPGYLATLNITPPDGLLLNGSSLSQHAVQLQDLFTNTSGGIFTAASTIFGGVVSFVLIVVLSFYLAVQDQGIDEFIRIITPLRRHDYVLNLWRRSQRKIGRWLQGQILLSLLIGVLIWGGLVILHVRYAFLLGLTAAVLEIIPVFGSILSAVPAVILSFIDGGTSYALMVIAMYVVVNQLEGNLIYPLVVQKVVGVPPLIVILAIIAGWQLGDYFGSAFLGILIAVPVAAALQEYVSDVQKGKRQVPHVSEEGIAT